MTVQDLIDQVRFKIQEADTSQVSDDIILDKLNLAKNYAYSKMAKHYLDPLLTYEELTTDEQELTIPEEAFQDRVVKVEYLEQGTGRWIEVRQVTFRELGKVSVNSTVQYPTCWSVVKRKIRFPNKYRSNTFRLWYIEDVGNLVKPQGRIDNITKSVTTIEDDVEVTSRPYITVDAVGDSVDPTDSYKKYISIVDATTGEVKNSLQVEEINDNVQLIFKETPTRTEVLNVPIEGEDSLNDEDSEIELDDYICEVGGTCVVYFGDDILRVILQYAANELREDLGTIKSGQDNKLNKLEKDLEGTKSGRQTTKRINNRSPIWRQTKLRRNTRR